MSLIIGIVSAIVISAFIYLKFKKASLAAIAAILALTINIFLGCIVTIPTGYTGILTTFGKVNEQKTLSAGLNIIAPWQDVVRMNNQVQKVEGTFNCFTSDLQETEVKINVSHRINQSSAMKIYKDIGKDYSDIAIYPSVYEIVKNHIGK